MPKDLPGINNEKSHIIQKIAKQSVEEQNEQAFLQN